VTWAGAVCCCDPHYDFWNVLRDGSDCFIPVSLGSFRMSLKYPVNSFSMSSCASILSPLLIVDEGDVIVHSPLDGGFVEEFCILLPSLSQLILDFCRQRISSCFCVLQFDSRGSAPVVFVLLFCLPE
jgi:hypothetical protein